MPNILVRDLDERVIGRLKAMAKNHGRSLQGEVKTILTESILFSRQEAVKVAAKWRKTFRNQKFSDSSDEIRKDRDH